MATQQLEREEAQAQAPLGGVRLVRIRVSVRVRVRVRDTVRIRVRDRVRAGVKG